MYFTNCKYQKANFEALIRATGTTTKTKSNLKGKRNLKMSNFNKARGQEFCNNSKNKQANFKE